MNTNKLATAAALLALPVGAVALPASAAARPGAAHHKAHHQRAHHARPGHKRRTVSFTARVVRSSASGLIVRTSDGRVLSFSKRQIKAPKPAKRHHKRGKGRGHRLVRAVDMQISSGNVVVNLLGLQPGVLVQITETIDPNGTVTITITLPPPAGEQQASGVVTEVDGDAFALQSGDGSALRLHMSSDALSSLNLQSCETVDVSYHQDAGILVADNVTPTGTATDGDCAPTYDATGSISQVSGSGVTINTDAGALTFSVDPSSGLADGYRSGDVVDVTYVKNSDGSLSATDIQFVEQDASGSVTAVTTSTGGGSLTITDDGNGQSETFIADPANGVQINARAFNGVSVGDQIGVSYHESAGQLVADTVTEQ